MTTAASNLAVVDQILARRKASECLEKSLAKTAHVRHVAQHPEAITRDV
jgi:hypothetical protein